MIELKGISFAYPGQAHALCDVSVRFPAGKVTTILGPNGRSLNRCVCAAFRQRIAPFFGNCQNIFDKFSLRTFVCSCSPTLSTIIVALGIS